jgi:hypothetical protein
LVDGIINKSRPTIGTKGMAARHGDHFPIVFVTNSARFLHFRYHRDHVAGSSVHAGGLKNFVTFFKKSFEQSFPAPIMRSQQSDCA